MFGVKYPIPPRLRAGEVLLYQVLCAGCNACYVGETTRHFSTRVREHMFSDRTSHILSTCKILSSAALHAPVTVSVS